MIPWILAVLALFFVQTMLGTTFRFLFDRDRTLSNLNEVLGGRDNMPPAPVLSARAERAVNNMQESLPAFLTVAVLLEIQGASGGLATIGAATFLVARTLYTGIYLAGIPGLRSAAWAGGTVGIVLMVVALLSVGG